MMAEPEQASEEVCPICHSDESVEENPLVFCDGCDMLVHKFCYGISENAMAAEQWFCDFCVAQKINPSLQPNCVLCPSKDAATLKRTTQSSWAHMCCAIWLPEVFFQNTEDLSDIHIANIPKSRWEAVCSLCNTTEGACLDCAACTTKFHYSCCIKNNLRTDFLAQGEPIVFCAAHQHLTLQELEAIRSASPPPSDSEARASKTASKRKSNAGRKRKAPSRFEDEVEAPKRQKTPSKPKQPKLPPMGALMDANPQLNEAADGDQVAGLRDFDLEMALDDMETVSEAGPDGVSRPEGYETQRIKNIERNRQQLENLGLLFNQGKQTPQRQSSAAESNRPDSRTRRSARGSVLKKLKKRRLPGESSGDSDVSDNLTEEFADDGDSEFVGTEGRASDEFEEDEEDWMNGGNDDDDDEEDDFDDEPLTDEDGSLSPGGSRPHISTEKSMQMQAERQKQWAELSAKADPTLLAQFTLELARVLLRCYVPTTHLPPSFPLGPSIFTPRPIHDNNHNDHDNADGIDDSIQQQQLLGLGSRTQSMAQSFAALGGRAQQNSGSSNNNSSSNNPSMAMSVGMGFGMGMVEVKGFPDPSVPLYVEFSSDHFGDDVVKAMANHILTDLGLDPRCVSHACRKLYGIFPPRDSLSSQTISAIHGFVTTALRINTDPPALAPPPPSLGDGGGMMSSLPNPMIKAGLLSLSSISNLNSGANLNSFGNLNNLNHLTPSGLGSINLNNINSINNFNSVMKPDLRPLPQHSIAHLTQQLPDIKLISSNNSMSASHLLGGAGNSDSGR